MLNIINNQRAKLILIKKKKKKQTTLHARSKMDIMLCIIYT